ncbi:hypothetical protein [Vibrio diazotrophicus]|uniref:hypothetical protein n=1 Tax=Vibrio diazotrophicus TaxID=685 RepID=UPI000C9EBFD4|nr:hypothetical protein [Vibrio diazotrophicus]PNH87395.1 hypothetical protein C1M59_21555 [Vibrio diazotrophicus]
MSWAWHSLNASVSLYYFTSLGFAQLSLTTKSKKYLLLEVVELLQAYAIVLRAYGGDPLLTVAQVPRCFPCYL